MNDQTPIEPGDVAVLPVRFGHVDLRTGTVLAVFDSAEAATDALGLIGPLADVEVDAIFGVAEPGKGGVGLAVSPALPVTVPPACEDQGMVPGPRGWDEDTEVARVLDQRVEDGDLPGSDW